MREYLGCQPDLTHEPNNLEKQPVDPLSQHVFILSVYILSKDGLDTSSPINKLALSIKHQISLEKHVSRVFTLSYAFISWCLTATLTHATAVIGLVKGAEQVVLVCVRSGIDIAVISVCINLLVIGWLGSLILCALDGSYFLRRLFLNLVWTFQDLLRLLNFIWIGNWLLWRQRSEDLLDLGLSITIQLWLGNVILLTCIRWVLKKEFRIFWVLIIADLIPLSKGTVCLRLPIGLSLGILIAKLHRFN